MRKLVIVWQNGDKDKVGVADDYDLNYLSKNIKDNILIIENDKAETIKAFFPKEARCIYFDD